MNRSALQVAVEIVANRLPVIGGNSVVIVISQCNWRRGIGFCHWRWGKSPEAIVIVISVSRLPNRGDHRAPAHSLLVTMSQPVCIVENHPLPGIVRAVHMV